MGKRNSVLLWFGLLIQILVQHDCLEPDDSEARAQMEEKAISSISLEEIEKMVENLKPTAAPRMYVLKGGFENKEQLIKHLEEKKLLWTEESPEKRLPYKDDSVKEQYYDNIQDSSSAESESDLETQASSNIQFFEDLVSQTMRRIPERYQDDLMTPLDFASSEYVPSYKPRFDYESYVKDPLDVKLSGKPYWSGPEPSHRRDSVSDGDGCRTVVKKLRDDEDSKGSSEDDRVKSVIISKECEYPDGKGPDAKIAYSTTEYQPPAPFEPSVPHKQFKDTNSDSPSYYNRQDSPTPSSWSSSSSDKPSVKDPLKSGYIDEMLEAHFKSFPRMRDPLSLLRHHHERLSLKTSKFDENQAKVEPVYKGYSYEHEYPESNVKKIIPESNVKHTRDNYKSIDHSGQYRPVGYTHSESSSSHPKKSESEEDSDQDSPKMMKKSFAYYRKDNPKSDPDNQEYAEEYAQGNYRSFSTDYDSDRDGPKEKTKS